MTIPKPSPVTVLLVWTKISIGSFGGGVATLGLIRQEIVSRQGWMSEEEFLREWSLCQLAPGINLVALSILVGRKVGGAATILASLAGLMLPSGIATIAITAAYAYFSKSPVLAAARLGIVPAVAGVGFATAWGMLLPIGKRHLSAGAAASVFYALLFAACFAAQRIGHVTPAIIVLVAGFAGALFNLTQPKIKEETP